jgi:hypothetical protein
MSDVRNPDPPPADDLPDPEEAELIAYLDGELEPADARQVEDRLDEDPAFRARADALKKSYDLLDYLPRPEPSPTFATRTLDRLPTSRSSVEPSPVPSGPTAALPAPAPPSRPWVWAAGIAAAAAVALGAGYFAADTARKYFHPPPAKEPDDIPLADLRVIENLPLYAVADDLEFVTRLTDPELFGDDSPDRVGPAADKPPAKQLDQLTRAFRALPPEQQARVRDLDRQLHEKEPAERARLFRSLEAYAAWLDRLPDAERRGVLSAGTPGLRLGVVKEIRERQWMAALPEAIRNHPEPDKRAELVRQWKEAEADRRRAWGVARKNWESFQKNDPPWPFNNAGLKKDVQDYVRAALRTDATKPDDRPRGRLNGNELQRLKTAQGEAEREGGWAWYDYGRVVYDLAQKYPMLPEPASGKMVLDIDDLWPAAKAHFQVKGALKRAQAPLGKWPDFALFVWEESRTAAKKQFTIPGTVSLGPSRPDEFKPPVRDYLRVLERKATHAEWDALRRLEGKWPEYPRELIKLAKAHDLSVPGAMLPGSPREWDRLYGPRPTPKGTAGEE